MIIITGTARSREHLQAGLLTQYLNSPIQIRLDDQE